MNRRQVQLNYRYAPSAFAYAEVGGFAKSYGACGALDWMTTPPVGLLLRHLNPNEDNKDCRAWA